MTKDSDSEWSIVDRLDEQRHYPRIPMDIPAAFKTQYGKRCTAKLVNISPDGAQVRCDVETAQVLHPRGGKVTWANTMVNQMSIILPVNNQSEIVSLCGRLLYVTTVADEPACVIGLKFLDIKESVAKILDRFFSEQLQI